MAHGMLSRLDDAFAIDAAETDTLADAWAGYLKHTSVSDAVDPKTRALFVLCTTMLAIEGPRLMRMMANKKAAKRAAQAQSDLAAQSGGRVVPMPGLHGV